MKGDPQILKLLNERIGLKAVTAGKSHGRTALGAKGFHNNNSLAHLNNLLWLPWSRTGVISDTTG